MAAITICSDFGAPQNKVLPSFPIYFPSNDGTRCPDLSFLNVELQQVQLLKGRKYYYALFADEKTEAQRDQYLLNVSDIS